MIKNILVALDGSANAEESVKVGLRLADVLGGRLSGIHVRNQWLLRGSLLHDVNGLLGIEPQLHMAEEMERFLDSRGEAIRRGFVETCAKAGRVASCEVLTGGVADTLVEEAGRHDLLVIGARGVSGSEGSGSSMGGGHLPAHLLRIVSVPMLVCPVTPCRLSSVTVAFDGSAGAFRALATAAELATRLPMALSVLWVDTGGLEYSGEDALALARRYLSPYDLEASFIELKGRPREALEGHMADHPAGLLAIGSHGSSRLRELLLGRLPEQIMADAPSFGLLVCP